MLHGVSSFLKKSKLPESDQRVTTSGGSQKTNGNSSLTSKGTSSTRRNEDIKAHEVKTQTLPQPRDSKAPQYKEETYVSSHRLATSGGPQKTNGHSSSTSKENLKTYNVSITTITPQGKDKLIRQVNEAYENELKAQQCDREAYEAGLKAQKVRQEKEEAQERAKKARTEELHARTEKLEARSEKESAQESLAKSKKNQQDAKDNAKTICSEADRLAKEADDLLAELGIDQ